jgi:hypothetical protein
MHRSPKRARRVLLAAIRKAIALTLHGPLGRRATFSISYRSIDGRCGVRCKSHQSLSRSNEQSNSPIYNCVVSIDSHELAVSNLDVEKELNYGNSSDAPTTPLREQMTSMFTLLQFHNSTRSSEVRSQSRDRIH